MAQKLYTQEQLKQAFIAGCDFFWDDTEEYYKGINDMVNEFTPIELPSDEEIYEQSYCPPTEYYNGYHDEVFIAGAKWMRDKILNK